MVLAWYFSDQGAKISFSDLHESYLSHQVRVGKSKDFFLFNILILNFM